MKNLFKLSIILILSTSCGDKVVNLETLKEEIISTDVFLDGDIIFQTSMSEQSNAIQLATNSKYSHIGIINKKGEEYFVLEAIQPVKQTPLLDFIKRGKDNHFVVKRLKKSIDVLNEKQINKMTKVASRFINKNYDTSFGWSDKKMYCSELVWKIYKRGLGIELCETKKLADFNVKNEIVATKLKERYGDNIPLKEKVVSPADIFNSELLELIYTK